MLLVTHMISLRSDVSRPHAQSLLLKLGPSPCCQSSIYIPFLLGLAMHVCPNLIIMFKDLQIKSNSWVYLCSRGQGCGNIWTEAMYQQGMWSDLAAGGWQNYRNLLHGYCISEQGHLIIKASLYPNGLVAKENATGQINCAQIAARNNNLRNVALLAILCMTVLFRATFAQLHQSTPSGSQHKQPPGQVVVKSGLLPIKQTSRWAFLLRTIRTVSIGNEQLAQSKHSRAVDHTVCMQES